MSSQMTVYYANCTEKPTNCRYPNKIDIVDEATAKECFSRDYVCCEFKKHYRSNAKFIKIIALLLILIILIRIIQRNGSPQIIFHRSSQM